MESHRVELLQVKEQATEEVTKARREASEWEAKCVAIDRDLLMKRMLSGAQSEQLRNVHEILLHHEDAKMATTRRVGWQICTFFGANDAIFEVYCLSSSNRAWDLSAVFLCHIHLLGEHTSALSCSSYVCMGSLCSISMPWCIARRARISVAMPSRDKYGFLRVDSSCEFFVAGS